MGNFEIPIDFQERFSNFICNHFCLKTCSALTMFEKGPIVNISTYKANSYLTFNTGQKSFYTFIHHRNGNAVM